MNTIKHLGQRSDNNGDELLKKALVVTIVVLIVAAIVYLVASSAVEPEPQVRFITVPVERGTLRAEISASGALRPLVEVLVGTQVSGTIKELYADFESAVKKGQLVAMIDPDRFEAKAQQARADFEAAKANLLKAEVALVDELRTLRRKDGLLEGNSISQSDYDAAKTKADAAEAQVVVEKARVAQFEAKLKEAELELKYTRIVAPVSGVVTSRTGDVGQTVTASFQTPVLFKIAEDLTSMQVHTNVDEADIGRVKVGQKAVFTVPAFPDQTFEASVSQIRNDPKVEQNVVTYNVVLDVINTELKLRPGMTANVQVMLSEVHDALMVPDQALRFIPSESVSAGIGQAFPPVQAGQKRLWKLENTNTITPINVKTGIYGSERVQIFSDELKPGDKVVVEAATRKTKEGGQTPGLRFKF